MRDCYLLFLFYLFKKSWDTLGQKGAKGHIKREEETQREKENTAFLEMRVTLLKK